MNVVKGPFWPLKTVSSLPLDLLSNYGLFEHFIDGEKPPKTGHVYHENDINKSIFKDKKLAKLWEKAERSGFSEKELKVLKEEFAHHQDKVDEYYAVLEKEEQQVGFGSKILNCQWYFKR